MAPSIRIRIGAAVDANVGNAFKPIVRAARDARQAVEDEMQRMWAAIRGEGAAAGGAKGGGPYRSIVREAEKAGDRIVAAEQRKQARITREQMREEARRRRLSENENRRAQRERERAEDKRGREKISAWKREQAETVATRKGRISAIGGGALETMGKLGKGALGIAGSVARGAGVQTDLGAYVGQAVELETRATELSAAAYQEAKPGEKPVERRDPKAIVAMARAVGEMAAFDPTKVVEGVQAFVGKTGDLATAEAAMSGLAKLSRATGTNLEDMVSAAGDAANALGDVGPGKAFATNEEKARKLVEVMRMIAGQGKVGAVEVKDLAVQMAKLGSAATGFGGEARKNVEFMGALAQMARAGGGAASATQAATAVQGFVNTLKTPARVKEMMGAGLKKEDIYDQAGNLQDPASIIMNALSATKGEPLAFKKLFANVAGARTVEPAAATYRTAYAGAREKGATEQDADAAARRAVADLFEKFTKPVSAAEEAESFKRSMDTSAAKVQQFNNKLSEIGGKVAEKLLPKLEKLGPTIVNIVEKFAGIIDFAAENPGKAAGIALAASIGKAGLESVVKDGIGSLLSGAAGSKGGSQALGALAIAATAITIGTVGKLMIDSVMDQTDKGVTRSVEADVAAGNAISALRGAARTGDVKQTETAVVQGKEQLAALEGRIARAEDPTSFFGALFGSKTFEQRSQEQNDAAKLADLKADRDVLKAAVDKLTAKLGGPLTVQGTVDIGNPTGPTANTAATTK